MSREPLWRAVLAMAMLAVVTVVVLVVLNQRQIPILPI